MAQAIKPTQIQQLLRSISTAQKAVNEKIMKIKQQLKRLESAPDAPAWITFKRVQTIKELRSPFPTLKQALKHDLLMLKSQLRALDHLAISARTQAAHRARTDFEKRLREILRNAEKSGSLSEEDLIQLRTEAESVVKQFTDVLNAAPSEKHMENVLESLETPLLLGSDPNTGVCNGAFQALAKASEKIVEQKDKIFRKNPSDGNLNGLLQSKSIAQVAGGNAKEYPAGWKPANTTHQVAKGDTLSKISERYYGNMSYWDVIYMENYGFIGDDVRKLRVGITLKIP